MKRIPLPLIFPVLVLLTHAALAQDTGSVPVSSPRVSGLLFEPLFYLVVFLAVVIVLTFYAMARAIHVLTRQLAPPLEATTPVASSVEAEEVKVTKPSAWTAFMNVLTRSVPVTQEKDILLDHNYDGIRELDNQLPPWWKWGFYVTIVFAAIYMLFYHVSGSGQLMADEYQEELALAALEKEARMKEAKNHVTEDNVAMLSSASELAEGQRIFAANCVTCHGAQAQGTETAPNLTDAYWLHGGGIRNVFRTVVRGVPGKAMISWSQKLSPRQINEVSSYLLSLQGSRPAGAKAAEGVLYEENAGTPDTANALSSSR